VIIKCTVCYSRVKCPTQHITDHFGDNLPSQSLDWCKNWSKPNQTVTKLQVDKVESVQRYFPKKLSGLSQLSYRDRLVKLDLQILERRWLVYDLVFATKSYMVYVMFLCLLSYHVVTLVVII